MTFTVWAPDGVAEVAEGDRLADLLLAVTEVADGDIVVVTSKIVSKAEGRVVHGDRLEWIESETARVVARRGDTSIVRTHHGITLAAAGVDASNVEAGRVVLLPVDPDASARKLRADIHEATGTNVAVIVSDTAGRAWRIGQTDIAIGAAGLQVSLDFAGTTDDYGNPLLVTEPAVADELAAAGDLAKGKLAGRPFAIVSGLAPLVLPAGDDGPGATVLARADDADMFGYGAREAVVQALIGASAAQPPFGEKAPLAEVRAAIARLPEGPPELAQAVAYAYGWDWAALRQTQEPETSP